MAWYTITTTAADIVQHARAAARATAKINTKRTHVAAQPAREECERKSECSEARGNTQEALVVDRYY